MAGGRKAAAVGYGSTLFTMPSGVAGPMRPPCTPLAAPAFTTAGSKEEEAGGNHRPQSRRQDFDLLAAV